MCGSANFNPMAFHTQEGGARGQQARAAVQVPPCNVAEAPGPGARIMHALILRLGSIQTLEIRCELYICERSLTRLADHSPFSTISGIQAHEMRSSCSTLVTRALRIRLVLPPLSFLQEGKSGDPDDILEFHPFDVCRPGPQELDYFISCCTAVCWGKEAIRVCRAVCQRCPLLTSRGLCDAGGRVRVA
jgi:hypothetical protein